MHYSVLVETMRTGGLRHECGANVEAANYSLVLRSLGDFIARRSWTYASHHRKYVCDSVCTSMYCAVHTLHFHQYHLISYLILNLFFWFISENVLNYIIYCTVLYCRKEFTIEFELIAWTVWRKRSAFITKNCFHRKALLNGALAQSISFRCHRWWQSITSRRLSHFIYFISPDEWKHWCAPVQ